MNRLDGQMPQPFINSTIELSQGGTEVAYRWEVDSRIFSEQAGIHDDNNDSWFVNAGAQHLMHALCVTMYLEPHTKGAWLFVSTIWNIFIEPDLMVLLFAESLPIHFCHDKYLLCHCRIILSITWGLQVIKHNVSSSILFLCVSFETFWRMMCFHLLFVLNLKDLQFEFYNFEKHNPSV